MDTFDFVNRANAEYIERLYQQYQNDPRSLEERWQAFFAGFDLGVDRTAARRAARQPHPLRIPLPTPTGLPLVSSTSSIPIANSVTSSPSSTRLVMIAPTTHCWNCPTSESPRLISIAPWAVVV